MTERDDRWICPHGYKVGFRKMPFPYIAFDSCGICCEEISERISNAPRPDGEQEQAKEK